VVVERGGGICPKWRAGGRGCRAAAHVEPLQEGQSQLGGTRAPREVLPVEALIAGESQVACKWKKISPEL